MVASVAKKSDTDRLLCQTMDQVEGLTASGDPTFWERCSRSNVFGHFAVDKAH